ncbi:hypothetical protein GW17_00053943, partial [Ensete ventricosum]
RCSVLGGNRAAAAGPNTSDRATGGKRLEQQDRAATKVAEVGFGAGKEDVGSRDGRRIAKSTTAGKGNVAAGDGGRQQQRRKQERATAVRSTAGEEEGVAIRQARTALDRGWEKATVDKAGKENQQRRGREAGGDWRRKLAGMAGER